jgi:hypothetical protein
MEKMQGCGSGSVFHDFVDTDSDPDPGARRLRENALFCTFFAIFKTKK